MVVTRQQMAKIAQALGHHVEHRAGGGLRHFLRHPRHDDAVLRPHFTVVGVQFPGGQLHQCGLPLAIAADYADAFAALDRQVDIGKQKGAADAEIDALQLDQGHPPILIDMVRPAGGLDHTPGGMRRAHGLSTRPRPGGWEPRIPCASPRSPRYASPYRPASTAAPSASFPGSPTRWWSRGTT